MTMSTDERAFMEVPSSLLLTATRHVRQGWFKDRALYDLPVLDDATNEVVENPLIRAQNATAEEIRPLALEQLRALYAAARREKEALDKELDEAWKRHVEQRAEMDAPAYPHNPGFNPREHAFRQEFREEPSRALVYDRERQLANALREWRRMEAELLEMRYYWGVGLGLFLLGGLGCRWFSVLGMALVVAGAVLMAWWSTPSFSLGGAVAEGHRVLINRLAMTGASLIAVVAGYALAPRWSRSVTPPPLTPHGRG